MNASALLRTALAGVPALETTIVHLSRPSVAQTLAVAFAEIDPTYAQMTHVFTGKRFEDLVREDFARLVEVYRSGKLLPLELGVAEPCMFGAIAGIITNMGERAPFSPADLPSHDCLDALHTLHTVDEAISTALDYRRFSAN